MTFKTNMSIIGIDPGNLISGVAVITNGTISHTENTPNGKVFDLIHRYIEKGEYAGIVVIEDIKPYSGRLTPQVIDTCKFIGELVWRLKDAVLAYETIPRASVKKWVYDKFPAVAIDRVNKKIVQRKLINKDGAYRQPSYIFVDDRIVLAAMKHLWNIDTPKPGKKNRLGISKHGWSALAVASLWMHK